MQQCLCSMTHTERENKMLTMKFFDGIVPRDYTKAYKKSSIFSKIFDSYNRYMIFRNTQSELHKLSDRELDDIGLSRGEIYDLAYQSAYGEYQR